VDVQFTNDTHGISILLHLDGGDTFLAMDPSLDVDALREEFAEVIERERQVDYPPDVVRRVVAHDRRRS
jgi:hypothetical protein